MGIYEDRQIHTKTGFQTIKSQDSQFALHTNRTPFNKKNYVNQISLHMQQNHTPAQYTNLAYKEPIDIYSKGITQRAHTKLCEYSSRISKNGTREEIRYVEICT